MPKSALHMVKVKEVGEIKLVGYRIQCPGEKYVEEIPKAAQRLNERIGEIKHIVDPALRLGGFVAIDSEDEDGYWVGVEVEEYEDIPVDVVTLTIPPQKYAVCRHSGPNYTIRDTYTLLHKWIEDHNYMRLKHKWHLEKFYSWNDADNVDVELYDTIA